jgi:hypothetical protein
MGEMKMTTNRKALAFFLCATLLIGSAFAGAASRDRDQEIPGMARWQERHRCAVGWCSEAEWMV